MSGTRRSPGELLNAVPEQIGGRAGADCERIAEGGALPHFRPVWQRLHGMSVVVGLIVYLAVSGYFKFLLGLLSLILMVFGGAFAIGRWWRRHHECAYWEGRVSIDENGYSNELLFPVIVRTPRPSIGSQALSGGRLRVEQAALTWRAGSLLTPVAKYPAHSNSAGEALSGSTSGESLSMRTSGRGYHVVPGRRRPTPWTCNARMSYPSCLNRSLKM